jgi:3-methyladenine DNA glycosylase AlkC
MKKMIQFANGFRLPTAPTSIEKGANLSSLLDVDAIDCLAHNISQIHPEFPSPAFRKAARKAVVGLGLMNRGIALAGVLRDFLPQRFEDAARVLTDSLGPTLEESSGLGLSSFFYLPHGKFIALYGVDAKFNAGKVPFETAMRAQYEITQRFTAEFSMRPFLIHHTERTLKKLMKWTRDLDPHVRRLCSEGSRPRLPWAERLQMFVKDPTPVLPILEALKDDEDLYVRRSVANHVGDIAKDHPALAMEICRSWLKGASPERHWVIRHAVRHPAKKGHPVALELRQLAARKR